MVNWKHEGIRDEVQQPHLGDIQPRLARLHSHFDLDTTSNITFLDMMKRKIMLR